MDIKFVVCFLLFHSTLSRASSDESSDCEVKSKTTSFLDVATQMIQNAKRSYRPCVQHKSIDCEEVLRAGHTESKIYTVWPNSRVLNGKPVDVFCDMDTDGGGWTVLQRRGNFSRPKDYFFQDWKSYKEGFGNIEKDFWLGNDPIFALSNQRLYSVRFDLKDVEGERRYALYDTFWIDDEDHKYTLRIAGYSGDAGDSMIGSHNGQKFSTQDQDNDSEPTLSCSNLYKGGWWYSGQPQRPVPEGEARELRGRGGLALLEGSPRVDGHRRNQNQVQGFQEDSQRWEWNGRNDAGMKVIVHQFYRLFT